MSPELQAVLDEDLDAARADPRRLDAVAATGLLDTPADESFDRLTSLAARLIGVPATFVSIVDAKRDFYKSCYGFGEPLRSTRQLEGRTFCHYAIVSEEPLVIEDTLLDPVFRDVPTVQSLGVRAYAGIPLRTEDGHAIGSFCAIDFAPRRWTELDLEVLRAHADAALREIKLRAAVESSRRLLAEARDLARSREQMLAAVMHDLRNPLNVISMSLQLLALGARDDQAVHVTRARRAIDSTTVLVNDLLETGRLRAGRLEARTLPIDAGQLLHDAAGMLALLASRQEITLETVAAEGLGQVNADYQLVLRVFTNLVGNAIKFSRPGSSVVLQAAAEPGFVRYSVIDRGAGMTAEQVSHVFDEYWQGDDRDRRGFGLGLSISRSIVESHGGSLHLTSVFGEGSQFSFTLPCA